MRCRQSHCTKALHKDRRLMLSFGNPFLIVPTMLAQNDSGKRQQLYIVLDIILK